MQNPFNESALAFPLLESFHLIGIAVGVGAAVAVDLRLLGYWRGDRPASQVWRGSFLWTLLGLWVALCAGFGLLSVDSEQYLGNTPFRVKMGVLALALLAHFTLARRAAMGRGSEKLAGAVSLTLWALVPLGGLLIGLSESLHDSVYLYLVMLWIHILSVAAWVGVLALDVSGSAWIEEGTRTLRRAALIVAAVSGAIVLAMRIGQYSAPKYFAAKLMLVVLAAAFEFRIFQRAVKSAAVPLILSLAAVGVAREPATIKDIMHSMVDPTADFLFQSVQSTVDYNGIHDKAPQTPEEWAEVKQKVAILQGVPEQLIASGMRAARMSDRSKNPDVENEPEDVQKLLNADHSDFERRAQRFRNSVDAAGKAVDARDPEALLKSLDGIDKACESCHLHYWYPNDTRAQAAAKEDGVD